MSKELFGDYPYLSAHDISGSSTGVLVKAGRSCVYDYYFYNSGGAVAYVKLYDKATAPDETDTPLRVYAIGALQGANLFTDFGILFTLGIGYRVTTGVANNNTTSPGANEVTLNIGYR
jgi:hypothetical protein